MKIFPPINQRVADILKKTGLNYISFGEKIGFSDVVVGNIVRARNKPSYDFIEKLILTFDWINSEWLITGKGQMNKEESLHSVSIVNESEIKYNIKTSETDRLLAEKDERIADLKQTIEILKKQLEKQNGVTKNDYAKNI